MDTNKIQAALKAMIDDQQAHPILLTRWMAWCVSLAVQLACRHPGYTGMPRRIAESVARQMIGHVVTDPDLLELARSGWNRHCDAPAESSELPAGLLAAELAPRPSKRDLEQIDRLLSDEQGETHFSAHLVRLIKRADRENRERIRKVFPHHVEALENWEATSDA